PSGSASLDAFVQYAPQGQTGQGEKAIACVDGLRDAPKLPERGTVAALGIAVFDVVMDEGEVMDELDSGSSWQGAAKIVGTGSGQTCCACNFKGEQEQSWA